jgi:hypothetical protein
VTKSQQPTPVAAAPGGPAATAGRTGGMTDPLVLFRWLDVILVVFVAPFALLAGVPVLGYAVGAAAWIANRAIGAFVERRAQAQGDVRRAVGLNLATLFARSWLVGLTILAVGLAGEREDGLTAALLLLAAFTLYFVTSLLLRPPEGKTTRP